MLSGLPWSHLEKESGMFTVGCVSGWGSSRAEEGHEFDTLGFCARGHDAGDADFRTEGD